MTDFNDEKTPEESGRDEYEIGYCKPPKHSQFPPGKSGNPKGKPKGTRNFSTDVKDTLKEPVRMKKDGKTKTVSTQRAALQRLREKALSGDGRALDRLMDLARTYNDDDMAREADKLSQTDDEILKGFTARQMKKAAKPSNDDDDNTSDGADTDNENKNTPEEDDDDDWLN